MELRGVITKVMIFDEDSHNVFAAVEYESGEELFSAKMTFSSTSRPPEGYSFVATGEMKESIYRGKTEEKFVARSVRPEFPGSKAGAVAFLGRFLREDAHGVSKAAIQKFVADRGVKGLKAAVKDPELLVAMSSKPSAHREAILSAWSDRTQGGRAVSLLEASGVAETAIDAVISEWRDGALERLQVNCYGAARIPEVGFDNADLVGKHLGIDADDRRRLAAAVGEVMNNRRARGSTATGVGDMMDALGSVSQIDRPTLVAFLEESAKTGIDGFRILGSPEGPICSPSDLFEAELSIARGISRMITAGRSHSLETVRAAAKTMFLSDPDKFKRLDAVQRAAIEMAASEPCCIVTGGPGTGKSTVMDAVARMVKILDEIEPTLAAPTGMAAKRLGATTGRKSSTVHLLLGSRGEKDGKPVFAHSAVNPLPPRSVVIVDETSMQDVVMMAAMLNALPPDGRVVLVGDPDQLESVGAGSFLQDALRARIGGSGGKVAIPCVKLINVYRSSKDGAIAKGAAAIRQGIVPDIAPDGAGGVSFLDSDVRDVGADIEKLVCERLVGEGFDPVKDVAVLCPQASGPGGTWDLNRRLSARLNPDGASIPGVKHGPRDKKDLPLPRVGDRVMLQENEKGGKLANGDEGVIESAGRDDKGKPTFKVAFDCGEIRNYPVGKWRDVIVSFAKTIHKFQGSQGKAVVMPVSEAHAKMNTRSLLYTGFTRPQSLLHLVGQRDALEKAVNNLGEPRSTLLERFLSALPFKALRRPNSPDWEVIALEAQAALSPSAPAAKSPATFQAPARLPFRPSAPARLGVPASVVPTPARPMPRGIFGGARAAPLARAPAPSPETEGYVAECAARAAPRSVMRSIFGAASAPKPSQDAAASPLPIENPGAARPAMRSPFGSRAAALPPRPQASPVELFAEDSPAPEAMPRTNRIFGSASVRIPRPSVPPEANEGGSAAEPRKFPSRIPTKPIRRPTIGILKPDERWEDEDSPSVSRPG